MAKAGDVTFKDGDEKQVESLVTIADNPKDAIIRAEEFIREYFGDDGFVADTSKQVGSTAKGQLYKVTGF